MFRVQTAILAAAACAAFFPGAVPAQDLRAIPFSPAAAHSAAVVAGGLIYVSGVAGADAPQSSDAIDAQTRHAFAGLRARLEEAGSSLGMAVNINVCLRHASDFDAMNAVYRTMFEADPPARTTIVSVLPGDTLIQLSAVAVPNGAERQAFLPAGWMKSPRPYSYIIQTRDLVFLSGLVSRRGTDDAVVLGSVTVQTATILKNAETLLHTVDLELDDVVSARVFLTDDIYFDDMNAAYKKSFALEPPARATAVVGLTGSDSTVEISLVATRGDKKPIGATISPTLPVSAAIRSGRRVFFSGVVGTTDTNASNMAAQAREAMRLMRGTLDAAGMTFSDIVDSTVYLTNFYQTPDLDQVYREIFPASPPARTLIGARLVSRGAGVEIVLTGYK